MRSAIEDTIERLIMLLDDEDAPAIDLEPDEGDEETSDAEAETLPEWSATMKRPLSTGKRFGAGVALSDPRPGSSGVFEAR